MEIIEFIISNLHHKQQFYDIEEQWYHRMCHPACVSGTKWMESFSCTMEGTLSPLTAAKLLFKHFVSLSPCVILLTMPNALLFCYFNTHSGLLLKSSLKYLVSWLQKIASEFPIVWDSMWVYWITLLCEYDLLPLGISIGRKAQKAP